METDCVCSFQAAAAEAAEAFLSQELPETVFGAPKAGAGMWASSLRLMHPAEVCILVYMYVWKHTPGTCKLFEHFCACCVWMFTRDADCMQCLLPIIMCSYANFY